MIIQSIVVGSSDEKIESIVRILRVTICGGIGALPSSTCFENFH